MGTEGLFLHSVFKRHSFGEGAFDTVNGFAEDSAFK
jgi:hypothetical protein